MDLHTVGLSPWIKGPWTPGVSCDTPGNLAISFAADPSNCAVGYFWRCGPFVHVTYRLNFSANYSTASGRLRVTGLPFAASSAANSQTLGTLTFQCVNKANYTQFGSLLFAGNDYLDYFAAAQGQPETGLNITDISNNQAIVLLEGGHTYFTDAP